MKNIFYYNTTIGIIGIEENGVAIIKLEFINFGEKLYKLLNYNILLQRKRIKGVIDYRRVKEICYQ